MRVIKKILRTVGILSLYHLCLAYAGALFYGHPSRNIVVIGVTGTKGKSSVTEMLAAIFEEAGYSTALLNSIRVKVGDEVSSNTMRMSMPGRMYIQKFLARAVKKGCTVAILEMTSEGARQYRHRGIELNALVFTNLAPEHIESHGSYEKYADDKFSLTHSLLSSTKRPRIMVANAADAQASRYLSLPIECVQGFTLEQHTPYESNERSGYFTLDGERIVVQQPGDFSLRNALAAALVARFFGIATPIIAAGLAKLTLIAGRAERIDVGQDFSVIVDYAHTPDSLEALYTAYPSRKICVLGATGGGRDTWKRPVMGGVAEKYCDYIILTNEDPYDENPLSIIRSVASGMSKQPHIIEDRREAIRAALSEAKSGDAVLITGKGTDPTIAGPNGTSIPWSDARVAREELLRVISQHT